MLLSILACLTFLGYTRQIGEKLKSLRNQCRYLRSLLIQVISAGESRSEEECLIPGFQSYFRMRRRKGLSDQNDLICLRALLLSIDRDLSEQTTISLTPLLRVSSLALLGLCCQIFTYYRLGGHILAMDATQNIPWLSCLAAGALSCYGVARLCPQSWFFTPSGDMSALGNQWVRDLLLQSQNSPDCPWGSCLRQSLQKAHRQGMPAQNLTRMVLEDWADKRCDQDRRHAATRYIALSAAELAAMMIMGFLGIFLPLASALLVDY